MPVQTVANGLGNALRSLCGPTAAQILAGSVDHIEPDQRHRNQPHIVDQVLPAPHGIHPFADKPGQPKFPGVTDYRVDGFGQQKRGYKAMLPRMNSMLRIILLDFTVYPPSQFIDRRFLGFQFTERDSIRQFNHPMRFPWNGRARRYP